MKSRRLWCGSSGRQGCQCFEYTAVSTCGEQDTVRRQFPSPVTRSRANKTESRLRAPEGCCGASPGRRTRLAPGPRARIVLRTFRFILDEYNKTANFARPTDHDPDKPQAFPASLQSTCSLFVCVRLCNDDAHTHACHPSSRLHLGTSAPPSSRPHLGTSAHPSATRWLCPKRAPGSVFWCTQRLECRLVCVSPSPLGVPHERRLAGVFGRIYTAHVGGRMVQLPMAPSPPPHKLPLPVPKIIPRKSWPFHTGVSSTKILNHATV